MHRENCWFPRSCEMWEEFKKNPLFHTQNARLWLGRGRSPPGTEPPLCDSFLL